MRRTWKYITIILLLTAGAARADTKEYQVKAALLLNFVNYIQWPASAFSDATEPFTIGVLGDDPFGPVLDDIFQGETVGDRKIVIKRSKEIEDLKKCQLLFVGKSESAQVAVILGQLKDTPVVTVGEMNGFAAEGGIINFYIVDGRVHFEINDKVAEKKGIRIDSQLLERARIVESADGKGNG